MSEHTPGPWKWIQQLGGAEALSYESDGGGIVLEAYGQVVIWNEQDKSLIAAAPDMLEMLEEIALEIRRGQDIYDWHSEIADTIEKAKGEQG